MEPSHKRADSGIQGPNLHMRKEKELVVRDEDFPKDRQDTKVLCPDRCLSRGLRADARLSTGSMNPMVVWGLLYDLKTSLLVTDLPSSSCYWKCQQRVLWEPELQVEAPRGAWSGGCSTVVFLQGASKS